MSKNVAAAVLGGAMFTIGLVTCAFDDGATAITGWNMFLGGITGAEFGTCVTAGCAVAHTADAIVGPKPVPALAKR